MLVLGAIAFANALGMVIVFPLGPFITRDLGVPLEQAALCSMAFTAAAAAGGLAGAFFLGRVNLRTALCATLAGVVITGAVTGLAPTFELLLVARFASGLCAGPLMGLLVAAISASVPEGERARAVGAIVGSYGLAIVVGLPIALAFATGWGGWRAAFWATSLFCAALLPPAWAILGRRRPDAAAGGAPSGLLRLLLRPESLLGLLLIFMASFGTLIISPHIAAYTLHNAGLGPGELQAIYAIGGGLSLLTTQATGWVMDRIGALPASLVIALAMTLVLLGGFGPLGLPGAALVALYGLLLAVQLARSTVAQASAARVAAPADRVAYQCLVAACTSLGQAAGAGVSTIALTERADGALAGMGWLAAASVALSWLPALVLIALDRRLARRGGI